MVKTIPQKNNKRYFSDILLSKTMEDSVFSDDKISLIKIDFIIL